MRHWAAQPTLANDTLHFNSLPNCKRRHVPPKCPKHSPLQDGASTKNEDQQIQRMSRTEMRNRTYEDWPQWPGQATYDSLLDPVRNAYIWPQHMGTWIIMVPPLIRGSPNGNYKQCVSLRHLLKSSGQMREWRYSSMLSFLVCYIITPSIAEIIQHRRRMNEYGEFVKQYWEGKTRVLGDKPAKCHFIHHLGPRWRWVVSFTNRPIYLQENSSL